MTAFYRSKQTILPSSLFSSKCAQRGKSSLLFLIASLVLFFSNVVLVDCFGTTTKALVLFGERHLEPAASSLSLFGRNVHNRATSRNRMGSLFSSLYDVVPQNDDRTDEASSTVISMKPSSDRAQVTFGGKSILITGASSGLGRAIALQLASASSCPPRALILSGRNRQALEQVTNECSALCTTTTTKVHMLICDLSNLDDVKHLGQKACSLVSANDGTNNGVIDILINNGGSSSRSAFVDTNIDVDILLMKVNFFAGACLAKELVPGMIQSGGGKIIWISSVQGLVGIPNRTSYAASKFAVQGYCESLRGELAGSNVTVHVISPGYIKTNLSQSAILGDGKSYGKTDPATAKGADPQKVAHDILESVSKGETDVVVAATPSAKVAIWLRFIFPSLLQKLLVSRFEKSKTSADGTSSSASTSLESSSKSKQQ